MICPNCGADVSDVITDYADFACIQCGLAGSREVLEALTERFSPASVLSAAERLLREAAVLDVFLRNGLVAMNQVGPRDLMVDGESLADVYAQLAGPRREVHDA